MKHYASAAVLFASLLLLSCSPALTIPTDGAVDGKHCSAVISELTSLSNKLEVCQWVSLFIGSFLWIAGTTIGPGEKSAGAEGKARVFGLVNQHRAVLISAVAGFTMLVSHTSYKKNEIAAMAIINSREALGTLISAGSDPATKTSNEETAFKACKSNYNLWLEERSKTGALAAGIAKRKVEEYAQYDDQQRDRAKISNSVRAGSDQTRDSAEAAKSEIAGLVPMGSVKPPDDAIQAALRTQQVERAAKDVSKAAKEAKQMVEGVQASLVGVSVPEEVNVTLLASLRDATQAAEEAASAAGSAEAATEDAQKALEATPGAIPTQVNEAVKHVEEAARKAEEAAKKTEEAVDKLEESAPSEPAPMK